MKKLISQAPNFLKNLVTLFYFMIHEEVTGGKCVEFRYREVLKNTGHEKDGKGGLIPEMSWMKYLHLLRSPFLNKDVFVDVGGNYYVQYEEYYVDIRQWKVNS